MKLREIEHKKDYCFLTKFENGEVIISDLKNLISKFVEPNEVKTAKINNDWGCLEFKNGAVDIEPKTLYHYAKNQQDKIN
jgi:hypothetical protein